MDGSPFFAALSVFGSFWATDELEIKNFVYWAVFGSFLVYFW
jgi:hypothetical protein